jgi:hypothetical protein
VKPGEQAPLASELKVIPRARKALHHWCFVFFFLSSQGKELQVSRRNATHPGGHLI